MTPPARLHGNHLPADLTLAAFLAELGSLCWRRAWTVILVWVGVAIVAGSAATALSERLLSGSGDVAGSASLRVDEMLSSEFRGNDAQSLILTIRPTQHNQTHAELFVLLDSLANKLTELPIVAAATTDHELSDVGLTPKAGSGHFLLIELRTTNLLATEQEVPRLRAFLAPLFQEAEAHHGALDWAITGRAALTHDFNRFTEEDATRAEFRALPLTLAVLILAFGSLVSAMLPLLLAVLTRTVAIGLIWLIAGSFDVSNLVLSIVTMLALALGIDYSLFLIHRYRRELERIAAEPATSDSPQEWAMRSAMAQSGSAVLYSAITVAIGMGALLATPLMETRSIGIGGALAVLVALLASLTLVPALLRLLGPRILEWPGFFSRRMNGRTSRRLWKRWVSLIMRRPMICIVGSVVLLLALAAPALHTRFGFPGSEFLPQELEHSRGVEMLGEMGLKGLSSPVPVVISDASKGPALTPDRVPQFGRFVMRLEQDPRVRTVIGPVESSAASPAEDVTDPPPTMNAAVTGALYRDSFISDDRASLLFRIIPSDDSAMEDLRDLATSIPALLQADDLIVRVGGQAQYYDDVDRAVRASYPLTIALVLGFSALALLFFFRAPLASAKALLLNLLSVAAGYGVVVLVFQIGYGAELFGLSMGTGVVPVTVPLVIFCILFGLSMDYEIFLISRVRTIFIETRDTELSIREALADTGSVITSAALIMVVVFGAFAFARVFMVQMIGLGLAVAVLVDATVIRSVLGPALMQVAGRWNWWPLQFEGVEPSRVVRKEAG